LSRLLAKQKIKTKQDKKSSSNQEWWEEDHDSDFHFSDEDNNDSDDEGPGLSSAMLIAGPRGSAKTATVYACAKELGYKVSLDWLVCWLVGGLINRFFF